MNFTLQCGVQLHVITLSSIYNSQPHVFETKNTSNEIHNEQVKKKLWKLI